MRRPTSLDAPPRLAAAPEGRASPQPASEKALPREAADPPAGTPTWSEIYERYLGAQGAGGCARAAACHRAQMGDAASAYEWLRQRGYIDGTRSALVQSNSCLRWFGGNMPPRGADAPGAVPDLAAWVAAGARED